VKTLWCEISQYRYEGVKEYVERLASMACIPQGASRRRRVLIAGGGTRRRHPGQLVASPRSRRVPHGQNGSGDPQAGAGGGGPRARCTGGARGLSRVRRLFRLPVDHHGSHGDADGIRLQPPAGEQFSGQPPAGEMVPVAVGAVRLPLDLLESHAQRPAPRGGLPATVHSPGPGLRRSALAAAVQPRQSSQGRKGTIAAVFCR
jgi:hypothetical protein